MIPLVDVVRIVTLHHIDATRQLANRQVEDAQFQYWNARRNLTEDLLREIGEVPHG